ncbi:MAG TPA: hypothetical protein PLV61_11300 [Parvularculaceae bacterium]|nr:hypothetical protein [Parvularculaceae bacterium]
MSRARFDIFRSGGEGACAFLPLIDDLSQRVSGESEAAMRAEATLWARGLARTAHFLGADAVIIGFDPSFAIAAARADESAPEENPNFAVFLDAIKMLVATEKERLGVIACLPGPCLLAQALDVATPADAKEESSALVRAVCECRPDIVMLREDDAIGAVGVAHQKSYSALRNVASYYDIPVCVSIERMSTDDVASIGKLRPAFLRFGADAAGAPMTAAQFAAGVEVTGVMEPVDFRDEESATRAVAAAGKNGARAITSLGQIAKDCDLEAVRRICGEINKNAA